MAAFISSTGLQIFLLLFLSSNIYINVFSIFYTSWHKEMEIFKIRNLKAFKTNTWSFYWNILQKMGRSNSPQVILNFSSFLELKNAKKILSWQPKFKKFLQSYLFATSNVPHYFSTRMESVIMLKMTNFWRPNLRTFHDVKKKIYFSYNTFVSMQMNNKLLYADI